ncbi:uncharacterized protein BO95DRAFT_430045 [Aspergillus brunneoviolaceus CBS 621.78]|uniref:Uncharacterized protein n=1 Tax=Aspergillus brunneoviolaceus CBS 621.78 TaxID=1450534 RepID=A0ACD1GEH2_9EURO|nr:hypothetical protein BO95DRAFT_430045 [Aspergillus brunneoviolaceus CBS 621.78]RAH47694.1 hypothetical protein BO95DRAFT_430045 [Aspergillus brunneoviolaceus CBS 621.78]
MDPSLDEEREEMKSFMKDEYENMYEEFWEMGEWQLQEHFDKDKLFEARNPSPNFLYYFDYNAEQEWEVNWRFKMMRQALWRLENESFRGDWKRCAELASSIADFARVFGLKNVVSKMEEVEERCRSTAADTNQLCHEQAELDDDAHEADPKDAGEVVEEQVAEALGQLDLRADAPSAEDVQRGSDDDDEEDLDEDEFEQERMRMGQQLCQEVIDEQGHVNVEMLKDVVRSGYISMEQMRKMIETMIEIGAMDEATMEEMMQMLDEVGYMNGEDAFGEYGDWMEKLWESPKYQTNSFTQEQAQSAKTKADDALRLLFSCFYQNEDPDMSTWDEDRNESEAPEPEGLKINWGVFAVRLAVGFLTNGLSEDAQWFPNNLESLTY